MVFNREYRALLQKYRARGTPTKKAKRIERLRMRPEENLCPRISETLTIPSAKPNAPSLRIWFVCAVGALTSVIAREIFSQYAKTRKLPVTLLINTTGVWQHPNFNRPHFIVTTGQDIARIIEDNRSNSPNKPPIFILPENYTEVNASQTEPTNRQLLAQILKLAKKRTKKP